ncbi:MAG: zinc ribbon domain-containing protein [Ignavibacteria bacterium]|nr:zinc ribbon domain-containing protein [Ignavibacteria bacterium]
MPTYEYRCHQCDHRFTETLTIDEHEKNPTPPCPKCKSSEVKQVFSAVSVVTSKKS